MPDTIDPSIPLQAGRNIPQFGPDPGRIMQMRELSERMQLQNQEIQQSQQEMAGRNALRNAFANPNNVIPGTNMLRPQAMASLFATSPDVALSYQKNMLAQQKEGVAMQMAGMKVQDQARGRLIDEFAPADATYLDTLKSSGDDKTAQKAAQDEWSKIRDRVLGEGWVPEALRNIPPDFNHTRYQTNALGIKGVMDEQRKDRTETRQIEQTDSTIQHQRAEETAAQQREARQAGGKWEVRQDKDGTDYRYNTETAEATTLDKKPYAPTAAGKVTTASAGAPLDDQTVDYWAKRVDLGDPLPSAYRDADSRKRIMTAVAKLHGENSDAAGEAIARKSSVRADTMSLGQITKIADAAEAYENTALKNIDIVKEKMPKGVGPTSMPWLDRWIESGRAEFGDANVPPYTTALVTVANEYAKVMSGSTGAQGSTVDARKEAASLLNRAQNTQQVLQVLDVMQRDMENKKAAYHQQRSDIQARISGVRGTDSGKPDASAPSSGEPKGAAPSKEPVSPAAATAPTADDFKKSGKKYLTNPQTGESYELRDDGSVAKVR